MKGPAGSQSIQPVNKQINEQVADHLSLPPSPAHYNDNSLNPLPTENASVWHKCIYVTTLQGKIS